MKYFIAKRVVFRFPEPRWCVFLRRDSPRPVCVARDWRRCVTYVHFHLRKRAALIARFG